MVNTVPSAIPVPRPLPPNFRTKTPVEMVVDEAIERGQLEQLKPLTRARATYLKSLPEYTRSAGKLTPQIIKHQKNAKSESPSLPKTAEKPKTPRRLIFDRRSERLRKKAHHPGSPSPYSPR